jgi:hypothetical protein
VRGSLAFGHSVGYDNGLDEGREIRWPPDDTKRKCANQSSVRVWAFWGGMLGAVLTYTHHTDHIGDDGAATLAVWIGAIAEIIAWAGLGALLAYIRNRMWQRGSRRRLRQITDIRTD